MTDKLTVGKLGDNLFQCADRLRGAVDKGEYKDYILPLVFYAEMNRRFQEQYEEELAEAGFDRENPGKFDDALREIAASEVAQGIEIPAGYSWEQIRSVGTEEFDEERVSEEDTDTGVAKFIDRAFEEFEKENSEYEGVFEDKYATVSSFQDYDGDQRLRGVVEIIDNEIYSSDKQVPPDMMGEAFMYLVKEFAEEEAGEYFTPPRIVRLVVGILEPFELGADFHDPTVGSAGMLVEAADQIRQRWLSGYYEGEEVIEKSGFREFLKHNGFTFSGQELNPTIAAIAKMNLALNRLDGTVHQGDSLTNPKFEDENGNLEKYDYILANFPFSQSGWKSETKNRAEKYGDLDWTDSLPHGNFGDFAFIMHMHSHLEDDGQLATIIPHGVLFRNGDQEYRKYLIENDLVEAVIGLPENLFESTGIPAGILVLNEDKPDEREGEVMFINADKEGEFYVDTGSNRNRLIDPVEDGEVRGVHEYTSMEEPYGTAEIKSLFDDWNDEERTCRVVDTDEIEENEYNMNIALYVDTTETQEDIDVQEALASIRSIEHEYQQLNQRFTQYMQQLNYEDKPEENKGDTE